MKACNKRENGCTGVCAPGKSRCQVCLRVHAEREGARRAERRKLGQCSVCGKPGVVIDGVKLSTCAVHREYYNARRSA